MESAEKPSLWLVWEYRIQRSHAYIERIDLVSICQPCVQFVERNERGQLWGKFRKKGRGKDFVLELPT